MVAYIIGFILIIIALIITGLIFRKIIYDRVDKLEAWKLDIMNRNVTAELQRVKALRLAGETQEKFESWKDNWDRILTQELPGAHKTTVYSFILNTVVILLGFVPASLKYYYLFATAR